MRIKYENYEYCYYCLGNRAVIAQSVFLSIYRNTKMMTELEEQVKEMGATMVQLESCMDNYKMLYYRENREAMQYDLYSNI